MKEMNKLVNEIDRATKKWFEISEDELQHRMDLQQKFSIEPIQKAVFLLEQALNDVLKGLGVDTEEDIPAQQDALGITIQMETRPELAGINGFYVYIGYDKVIPYAWVGAAQITSDGKCKVEVHFFMQERMVDKIGPRIIQ